MNPINIFYNVHCLQMSVLALVLLAPATAPKAECSIRSSSNIIRFDADNGGSPELILNEHGLGIGGSPSTNLSVYGNSLISRQLAVGGATSSSNLHISGTMACSLQTAFGNVALGATSYVVSQGSGNTVLTIPKASSAPGRIYCIKNSSSRYEAPLKVEENGTIDGHLEARLGIGDGLSSIKVISDSVQWYILAESGNVVVHPELYLWEAFDYPVGYEFSLTSAENGWSSGWKASEDLLTALGSGNANASAGSISANVFTSQGLCASGNKFEATANKLRSMYRGMNRSIDWDSDSAVYMAILIDWESNHSSNASMIRFTLLGGGTEVRLGLQGDNANTNYLTLYSLGGGSTVKSGGPFLRGTYLLAVKFAPSSSGNDAIYMSMFSENDSLPASEPSSWDHSNSFSKAGAFSVLQLSILVYHSAQVKVDEIRMGPSWADVVSSMP